jgi:MoxR-like ATPase
MAEINPKLNEELKRIIEINRVAFDNNLHKIPAMDKSLKEGYSKIKPMLNQFRTDFGLSPNKFLETYFESTFGNSPFKVNDIEFQIKSFGHWGRSIHNYVWATVFLKNKKTQPYSNSIQIYVLVDHKGLKYGFDYGDKVKNNHPHVEVFRSDDNLKSQMLKIINDTNCDVIEQDAGSPLVELGWDSNKNIIKSLDDFKNWNEKIHLIANVGYEDLLDGATATIVGDTQYFFGNFRNLITNNSTFFSEKNNQKSDLFNEPPINNQDYKTNNENSDDLFLDNNEIETIVDLLISKKNIILQGPPGTGKTFMAKKICKKLVDSEETINVSTIQFHQSYSYEDFIQGYRPTNSGFELKNGIFLDICNKAKELPHKKFFLIIDEINRGNLSKIFGELMMLIENDKRGEDYSINLTYSDSSENFYIPENIYLIGTMNTADRSLSIVDYALRRRFAFINIEPKFNQRFADFLKKQNISDSTIDKIINKTSELNEIIESDESLGKGFKIGHSYFCNFQSIDEKIWLNNIFNFEIKPLLEEYWYDDEDSLNNSIEILFGS